MEGLGAPGSGGGNRGLRGARAVPGAADVSRAGCPGAWRKGDSTKVTKSHQGPRAPTPVRPHRSTHRHALQPQPDPEEGFRTDAEFAPRETRLRSRVPQSAGGALGGPGPFGARWAERGGRGAAGGARAFRSAVCRRPSPTLTMLQVLLWMKGLRLHKGMCP